MGFRKYLNPEHPSYGCEKAVFLFRLVSSGNVVAVEAINGYSVACLERYSIHGQKVSDNCHLIAVIRGFTNVGVRNDGVKEIPYVDFILDIVNRDILESDTFGFECFMQSLNEDERSHAERKMKAMGQKIRVEAPRLLPMVSKPEFTPVNETVKKTLISLGFNKKDVESWAKKFDASNMTVSDMIKAGCQGVGKAA
jgi:hypothetical protein